MSNESVLLAPRPDADTPPCAPLTCGFLTPSWPPQSASNGIVTYVGAMEHQLRGLGHLPVALTSKLTNAEHAGDHVITLRQPHTIAGRFRNKVRRWLSANGTASPLNETAQTIARAATNARLVKPIDILEMEESFGLARHVAPLVPFPVVVRLHGPWFLNGDALGMPRDEEFRQRVSAEREAIAAAAGVSSPSHDVLERTRAYYDLELPDAQVIANPLPPAEASWDDQRAEPDSIAFVGRFDRHKGGDLVLQAFARVLERKPQAVLYFAGPDRGVRDASGQVLSLPEYCEKHLTPHVGQRLRYLGQLSAAEVIDLRMKSAVTVVATRYETFGYVALEAMSLGCPVVATDAGAISEIVSDGRTGLLAPPEDPDALAASIVKLLSDRDLAVRLGQAAASDAAERFNPRRLAAQTVSFYQQVIARWNERSRGPENASGRN